MLFSLETLSSLNQSKLPMLEKFRKLSKILFTFWTLVFCFFNPASVALGDVTLLDRVVAIVDDDVVLQSELDERLESVRQSILARGTSPPSEQILKQKVLDQLVLESIQLQAAERLGLRISDSELNQTMQKIASQNNLSLEQFQDELQQQGLTYQGAREQIKREMLLSRYQQRMVDRRVRVTEKEVQDFLNSAAVKSSNKVSYRLAHILLTFPEGDTVAAQQVDDLAQSLLKQINQGSLFADLAVQHSQASTALQGGDLGWRSGEELPTLFADIVPGLSKGQISEPIKTKSAVHLVQLVDVRGGKSKVVQQSRVRHILIRLNELRDDLQSKKLIDEIHQKIVNGEDFAELARAYTDDAVSSTSGGDLNWVSPGQMVPQFEEMMNSTAKGEVSKPFRTEFGWHILEVMDRRAKDIGELVQANQARQILHRRRYEEELQSWLGEIRDESYIELKI